MFLMELLDPLHVKIFKCYYWFGIRPYEIALYHSLLLGHGS